MIYVIIWSIVILLFSGFYYLIEIRESYYLFEILGVIEN